MFTLDICHPEQSFSNSAVAVVAIIPASPAVAQFLPESGRYYSVTRATLSVRAADAPDPPPPKTRA